MRRMLDGLTDRLPRELLTWCASRGVERPHVFAVDQVDAGLRQRGDVVVPGGLSGVGGIDAREDDDGQSMTADGLAHLREGRSTKGGRERTVGIDAGTVRVLKKHCSIQMRERLAAGAQWSEDGYVFARTLGEPLYPDTVTQLMPKLIASYNEPADKDKRPARPLPRARLHDLRHVHASMLLLAGVPVHVVAERLGHADPAITLRVYAHVIRQHTAGVADVFAAQIQSASGRAVSKGVSKAAGE